MKSKLVIGLASVVGLILLLTLAPSFSSNLMSSAENNSNVQINVINNDTGGNVKENSQFMANIPSSNLSRQIINASEQGTPIITIGSGDPKIMIVAGVHGNELPPQIAAIMVINNLKDKKLKGTVYIVPFAIPSSTAQGSRYFEGQDPNRVADTSGSPTSALVMESENLNVDFVGDFHSTQPGGDPGKEVVMCCKDTSYESFKVAEYMRNQLGCDIFLNPKNSEAMKNVLNSNGIPTVTSEIVADHGTTDPENVQKSYEQMMAFISYSGII